MIFDQSQSNLNAWKTEMHLYEKGKRTKKPFGQSVTPVPHVTHEQMKAKECSFNPVLQTYARQEDELRDVFTFQEKRAKSLVNHLRNTVKHQKNFDIVNLQSNEPYTEKIPVRKLGPIRNAFNVINNQKMPDYYFQNREMKLVQQKEKKLLGPSPKQYNIVTNVYREANEDRIHEEMKRSETEIKNKYWKTHDYDPVFGKYYDEHKEEEYQKERKLHEQVHGLDAEKHLPPSYVYREPFIADYTKPLPESLQILDERNANAKKRFQMKYIVLDEYQKRNIEQESKQQSVLKNHVHFGRVLDEKAKEFDIVTNKPYKQTRAEELYGKKLEVPSWDHLIKQASKGATIKSTIKTGGFS